VTSQLGFDALCAGIPVICFGAPFYAGWGLTEDHIEISRRATQRSLIELVAACWLHCASYVDPVSGRRCSPEDALEHLARQRRACVKNQRPTLAVGFSKWKRKFVRPFLDAPGAALSFIEERELDKALDRQPNSRVVTWGQRISDEGRALVHARDLGLTKMEDGFLRSVQLGSDLTRPASIVLDDIGIYYDGSRPSRLEQLLETHPLGKKEAQVGRQLIDFVIQHRLSKYNVQNDARLELPVDKSRRVHLVVGQVEDDASVLLSTFSVRSNGALLREVRKRNPDDFIVFKPHPDVLSGNRKGALSAEDAACTDHVAREHAAIACLDVADEVHTMTSLMGFESLIRGIKVSTYGLPFYAGWGLTQDAESCQRRTRRLSVEELAYCTLALYPTYYSARCKCFVSVEQAMKELWLERETQGRGTSEPTIGRRMKRLGRYLRGLVEDA
jgi:capsular polysaccharide export protein